MRESINKPGFVIAVASGKGGVGKTCLSANLGLELANKDNRVCVFDMDTGLANINIMLRLQPSYSFTDVLRGDKKLQEVIIHGPDGLDILSAGNGINGKVELDLSQKQLLKENLEILQNKYDYLIVDLAAGIGDTVVTLLKAIPTVLLVITAEPTSLTDAFSVLKLLKQSNASPQVQIVINQVDSNKLAIHVFNRFSSVVKKFLDFPVDFLGAVPLDNSVNEAIGIQKPLMHYAPYSNANKAMQGIADKLIKKRYQANSLINFENLQALKSHSPSQLDKCKKQKQQHSVNEQSTSTLDTAKNLHTSATKIHHVEEKTWAKREKRLPATYNTDDIAIPLVFGQNGDEAEGLLTAIRIVAKYCNLEKESID